MRKSDPEVRWVAEALQHSIRMARMSQKDIEAALGLSQGYLSQLLHGNVDLKLKHIFEILGVLGVEPSRFFAKLYEDGTAATHGLMARIRVAEELEGLKLRVARLEYERAKSRIVSET